MQPLATIATIVASPNFRHQDKADQRELDYGLSQLMLLQPKRYLTLDNQMTDNGLVIKGSGEETIGLVAQEVYKVMPEAVYKPKDDSKELSGI